MAHTAALSSAHVAPGPAAAAALPRRWRRPPMRQHSMQIGAGSPALCPESPAAPALLRPPVPCQRAAESPPARQQTPANQSEDVRVIE